ncbi:hypothetical protein [Dongshaea marina]|uniref:hypothetical protein n=1 Tax=Dongshaea marina TaxID=2047966 RepID=UPI000D3E70CE|nr:hypothetical protein [Dongshaea marina]
MTDSRNMEPQDPIQQVFAYHQRTKHQFDRYANSLGYMDWATQPNPFRLFEGAPGISLEFPSEAKTPLYGEVFSGIPRAMPCA